MMFKSHLKEGWSERVQISVKRLEYALKVLLENVPIPYEDKGYKDI